MRRISAGESKDISTERAIVHRAFMTTTSRGGVAPFCGRPDGKHPCGVLCDTLTDAVYEVRAPAAARIEAAEAEALEQKRGAVLVAQEASNAVQAAHAERDEARRLLERVKASGRLDDMLDDALLDDIDAELPR